MTRVNPGHARSDLVLVLSFGDGKRRRYWSKKLAPDAGGGSGTRTHTTLADQRLLRPLCLPIPPSRPGDDFSRSFAVSTRHAWAKLARNGMAAARAKIEICVTAFWLACSLSARSRWEIGRA